MACFLVPLAEAVVTTTAQIILDKKEKKNVAVENKTAVHTEVEKKFSLAKALKPLNIMLWGGSALLAFEHLWHGEIVPWFPFLTAADNAEDTAVMLHEMGTIGVTMAVAVTAVWGIALLVKHIVSKKKALKKSTAEDLS
jgi:hypothetical protein